MDTIDKTDVIVSILEMMLQELIKLNRDNSSDKHCKKCIHWGIAYNEPPCTTCIDESNWTG